MALSYRILYTVFGGYVTASLAPHSRMRHVFVLGVLGLSTGVPGERTELARFPAIEGKTWNHPALVGDLLLVRNGEEVAAFRLALAGR